jgi:hypothetical protein
MARRQVTRCDRVEREETAAGVAHQQLNQRQQGMEAPAQGVAQSEWTRSLERWVAVGAAR